MSRKKGGMPGVGTKTSSGYTGKGRSDHQGMKGGGYVLNPGYSGAPAKFPTIKGASKWQVGTSVPVPSGFRGGSPEVVTTKMPGGKSSGARKGGV